MMKFQNKQDYLEQKTNLMNEIEELMKNEGTDEEVSKKLDEVENMRNAWQEQAKELANKAALENKFKILNLEDKGVKGMKGTVIDSMDNNLSEDMFASLDYRKAFMNNVINGSPIPNEFKNENTKTTDLGSLIPTTVMEKIIEKLEATGMILPLVTRTSYKGGVSIPVSSLKPVASWVGEGAGSDKQKFDTKGTITFAYYKLRCAVSVSFESDNISLAIFETTLINNVVEAMTKSLELAIINGTGVGQPKGILTEEAATGQTIQVSVATGLEYENLVEAEGSLPIEYENGAVWCMTKKTFMKFIGMTDDSGQPIARINYGINGKPERILLGRPVVLTNYLPNFSATTEVGAAFAFLFNFKDYVLNTNYAMTIKKYEDNETDDQVTKSIMLADGKVVDKNSLVKLVAKA